jgi:hypothetical protein
MASLPRLEATVRRLMGRIASPSPASSTSAALWVYEREPSEGGRTAPLRDQRPPDPAARAWSFERCGDRPGSAQVQI